ncbi:MAG TPA: hypothetical protein VGC50_14660 [Gammaproteobacteria bacterium]
MEEDIIRLNIERFRRLLSETMEESRRRMLLRLLAEEESKQVRNAIDTEGKK